MLTLYSLYCPFQHVEAYRELIHFRGLGRFSSRRPHCVLIQLDGATPQPGVDRLEAPALERRLSFLSGLT